MSVRPICVDLDATLVRADGLAEGLIGALRRPATWLPIAAAAFRGRAALRERVATLVPADPATLPYRTDLVAFLRAERMAGRTIVLATGADRAYAGAIAEQLELFDLVLASDGTRELVGRTKRDALVERFGKGGYDFVGDGRDDAAVAASAATVHPAGSARSLRRLITAEPSRAGISFGDGEGPAWRHWLRLLRPHHWAKNLLVGVPVVAAHRLLEPAALGGTAGAFVAFSAAASSVYLLNDILDVTADRLHPRKRLRPVAAGDIGASAALLASAGLALLALGVAALTGGGLLAATIGGYLGASLLYSAGVKRVAPVDTVTLAGLQLLRILGGTVASGVATSPWLLGFAFATLWSFALAKRTAELAELSLRKGESIHGRDWVAEDRPLALAFGAALMGAALLTLILYAGSDDALRLYARPEALWLVIPLIAAWTSRLWLIAWRGLLRTDPILWGLTDRTTLVVLALAALLVLWGSL
jgi:4-hydroxybenzoate polyprenyltransferase/phosphoserine phosphatase